jgi:hypothetical protein
MSELNGSCRYIEPLAAPLCYGVGGHTRHPRLQIVTHRTTVCERFPGSGTRPASGMRERAAEEG